MAASVTQPSPLTALGMGGVPYPEPDEERLTRLRGQMQAAGVDALVLRLPENILYATGFWPLNGVCAALFPLSGTAALVVARGEEPLAADAWTDDIRTYIPLALDRLAGPDDNLAAELAAICAERGLTGGGIGYEGSFDLLGVPHWQGEVRIPSEASLAALRRALPEADLRDATGVLRAARTVKSARELGALRRANEVAALGLAAGKEAIRPGATEMDVAQAVEWGIYRYSGAHLDGRRVERARGFASVMSGPNTALACLHFNLSTPRRLEPGDLVTIELGAYADGYWTDLTRVHSVGEPDARQREICQIVRQAQLVAIAAARPGVTCAHLDELARGVITRAGYGANYPHILGHGTGLQYHEPPVLHPKNDHVVEAGEVYTIEPGIYVDGWGGVRLEDLIAVRATGEADVLSACAPRDLRAG
jgi:Xaa-Pro aminopeptidase